MALSRFWSYILVCSILYIFTMLALGKQYTIGNIINGKQNEELVVDQVEADELRTADTSLFAAVVAAGPGGLRSNDTLYRYLDNRTVEVCVGRQAADGVFPTCKNTIMDIWLPLIGYLTFFCGLLNLLNDSNAIGKLAGLLAPFFCADISGVAQRASCVWIHDDELCSKFSWAR